MMNICKQCTFANHSALIACEMCEAPLEFKEFKQEAAPVAQEESIGAGLEMADGVQCPQCTMINKWTALQCSMCHTILPIQQKQDMDSKENRDNDNVIDFDGGYARSNSSGDRSGDGISAHEGGGNGLTFFGNQATDGLVELLEVRLHQTNSLWKLCSPFTHFTQLNAVGAEWACGFRNIQMLCSSLIQVPRYRSLLFNGDGDIPDVHGIQSWIERAWADGFDVEGAADFPNGLLGTNSWVGPSECVSMLRYFGIRAHMVDFLDEDYAREVMNGQVAASIGNGVRGVSKIANYVCDVCNMKIERYRYHCTIRDNYDLCEACEQRNEQPFPMTKIRVESAYSKPSSALSHSHDFGGAQAYSGGGRLKFVPLTNHVRATSSSGRRTSVPKSYSDFGGHSEGDEHYAVAPGESGGGANKRKMGSPEKGADDDEAGAWPIQWTDNASHRYSHGQEQKQKKRRNASKNSKNLVNWVERYFEAFEAASSGSQSVSRLVHPLYLQHDGHSRTAVGLQKEEHKTNLLMFDPQVQGSTLRQCLGGPTLWQKHIKRQVATFDVHRHLQVVYVSGVMSAQEREASKLLQPRSPEDSLIATVNGAEQQS